MATPEKKVKDLLNKIVETYTGKLATRAVLLPYNTLGLGKDGYPDFLFYFRGLSWGIETKAKKNKLSVLQKRRCDELRRTCQQYIVINETNIGIFEDFLLEFISETDIVELSFYTIERALLITAEALRRLLRDEKSAYARLLATQVQYNEVSK